LDRSNYPTSVSLDVKLSYIGQSELLVADITLPNPDSIPHVSEYNFISTKKIIQPKEMKENEFIKLYNNVIYQIVLRTIHEIFESDYKNHIKLVVINGLVK